MEFSVEILYGFLYRDPEGDPLREILYKIFYGDAPGLLYERP